MNIKEAQEIIRAGLVWASWTDEQQAAMKLALKALFMQRNVTEPIPIEKWHEDDGNVIWWRLPINEPPYVGTPLDSEFIRNYYTHFTILIEPLEADD